MSDSTIMLRLWRKLSDNQRLLVVNGATHPDRRVEHSKVIVAMRALDRLHLIDHGHGTWALSPMARALGCWAQEHGYARRQGNTWVFHSPGPVRRRIDPARLAELVTAGHYCSSIAEQLGVSDEAVYMAARRHGLTLARKRQVVAR